MKRSTKVYDNVAFSLSGAGTTNVELSDCIDFSWAEELMLVLKVTSMATDSTDTLAVKLQSTDDRVVWDTRINLATVAGNAGGSSTDPVTRIGVVHQTGFLDTTEEEHLATGAHGGSEIPAGSVRNGQFPGPYRGSAGRQAAWRLSYVVTDPGAGVAAYGGTATIWAR